MIPLNLIKEFASCRTDREAIADQQHSLTWQEYHDKVEIMFRNMHNTFNIYKIRSICYISPNRSELFILAAAAATLKIPFVGIDYTQKPENIKHMLDVSDCGLIVISSSFFLEEGIDIRSIIDLAPIIDLDNGLKAATHYSRLEELDSTTEPDIGQRTFKAISFTSGTSGPPKAAVRYASFDARRFNYFKSRYGFSSEDKYMLAMPMYHAAGNGWARLFMSLGATVIIAKPHDTKDMVRLIKSEKITASSMTPPLLLEVISHANGQEHIFKQNSLRFLLVGGKNFPIKLKLDALHILGPVVYEYYGTTETGVNTIAEPHDIMKQPTSVGKPYDGNKLLILDEQDRKLTDGEIGRVAVSSYMNMDEYHSIPHDTVEYVGDKYLLTAETGYIQGGLLFLMNRAQNAKGLKIYETENAISKHPGVRDLAIVPTDTNNSKVICGIVASDHTDGMKSKIYDFAKREIKKNKMKCSKMQFLEKIPYSPSGKVRMEELKNMLTDGPYISNDLKRPGMIAGILCLLLTTLSWGGMFPIAKNALLSMDAVHISLIRYGIASLILLILLAAKEGISALNPGRQVFKLYVFGSLGFAGFSILAFAGLAHTKPQHGAIIMALMPLISVIMIWVLKKQKPSNFTFGSIFFALLGVVLVVSKGSITSLAGGALLPNLVILLGAFCWVTYTIGASYIEGFSSLRYTAISAGLGSITIGGICLLTNMAGVTQIPSASILVGNILELSYLVVFAGVVAVFSWNHGIKTVGPVNGVLFINLVPITAFAIAFFSGDSIVPEEVFGSALVILSLIANNMYARGWFNFRNKTRLAY
ncbi:AMP-binding protein [Chromohalobacter canadensis]|uniref:AMP-binding protein n=1 Tax=Chromohalobacter canadensis TaxID=141389 RepID=A0ABZ0Y9E8_9GAMM|nr:AMP-binding protein [Chromohalobacter canadensis]MCK0770316.1 AMP-binding protein [Chromohalobacter canadensis]WQH08036.1 AMP-binding protein [Chromohalobacter canadensis]